MAYSTFTPDGFRPVRTRGGTGRGNVMDRYRINPAGLAQSLGVGDPVKVTAGYIQRCSATTDYTIGVFAGCVYNDPASKRPTWSMLYVANTSVGTDPAGIQANIWDNEQQAFVIQADASVTVADVGLNFDVTLGAPGTVTQRSTYGLKASSRKVTTALVRVIDIHDEPGNAFGDPFPKVVGQFVQTMNTRNSAT